MSRRKAAPAVARPGTRRRLIELGKDLLILLLSCSALLLVWQTPIATQVRGWVAAPTQTALPLAIQRSEAVLPYAVAVRNSRGLYGAGYDRETVSRNFERFSGLLGEGLSTAAASESISQSRWQALVESPGIYCVFQGSPPLSALSAFLGGGGGNLSGSARALLLAWDGKQVYLCWREGTGYWRAATQVAYEDHLETILDEFSPNGAAFSYTLAQTDSAYSTLDPYVLVSMTTPRPQVYTAATPDFVGDREALEQLLKALGFQPGVGSTYETAGELAINEGGDRLRVNPEGKVTFYSTGEDSRYPVPSAGDTPTAPEAALAAWDLLNRAAAPWRGEDDAFVLSGMEETAGGWVFTFHTRLNGIPALVGQSGWAARFTVSAGEIREFTLHLRSCAPSSTASVVPGERLAAAALRSLPNTRGQLILCYSETGSGEFAAGWVTEE